MTLLSFEMNVTIDVKYNNLLKELHFVGVNGEHAIKIHTLNVHLHKL